MFEVIDKIRRENMLEKTFLTEKIYVMNLHKVKRNNYIDNIYVEDLCDLSNIDDDINKELSDIIIVETGESLFYVREILTKIKIPILYQTTTKGKDNSLTSNIFFDNEAVYVIANIVSKQKGVFKEYEIKNFNENTALKKVISRNNNFDLITMIKKYLISHQDIEIYQAELASLLEKENQKLATRLNRLKDKSIKSKSKKVAAITRENAIISHPCQKYLYK